VQRVSAACLEQAPRPRPEWAAEARAVEA
jgi:hypothetical protein